MDKHIAERWVQALRSGQYKQGVGELHPSSKSYCCLGVLCDLYRIEQGKGEWVWQKQHTEWLFRVSDREQEVAVLPPTVCQWADMTSTEGAITNVEEGLAALNDSGSTFSELADLIEKKWEVL